MINNFTIIDTHTHIFPDSLAERAISSLSDAAAGKIKPEHNGTAKDLIKCMDESGIDKSLVLSIATKPAQVDKINLWAAEMNKQYSSRLLFSGSLHFDSENIDQQVAFLTANDITVIKLHPEYQYFYPLNKKLDRIYRLLQDNDIAVYFHAGNDIAFVGARATPDVFSRMIDAYPKLKIIAAHLGGFLQWEEVIKRIAGSEIWLDFAFTFGYITKTQMQTIISKHGSDKLLFGTDSPWRNLNDYINNIFNLNFSEDSLRKILCENAKKLFKGNFLNYA